MGLDLRRRASEVLNSPVLPFFWVRGQTDKVQPGDVDENGNITVAVYGPDGEPLADSSRRIRTQIERFPSVVQFSIANGANLSDQIDINGASLAILIMPDGWTAANITFQAGQWVAGNFRNVYDDSGTEVVITAALGRAIPLPVEVIAARYIKVRSGTSGTPVNQAAERDFTLVLKG